FFPRTDADCPRHWVCVGGTSQSVLLTAHYRCGIMRAIIGGTPDRFAPYVDLYRCAHEKLGTNPQSVGMHSPGFVAATDEEVKELFYPGYREIRDRIGALRGWPPLRRSEIDAEVAGGSLYVGSVETVAATMAHA